MRISSDEHTFHDDDLDSRTPPARQVQPQFEGSESPHGEKGDEGGFEAVAEPEAPPKQEEEGVFEIRDFTNASAFERLSHQISLAAKRWAAALKDAQVGSNEDVLQMKESFDHANFRYELFFHLAPMGTAEKKDRLGLHAFPTRAHRVQRWFGVRHFVFVSLHNHNIDIDSARTMLGAAALAVRSASFPLPLSCFVPIDGGRRRVLGELLDSRCRVLYTTDLQHTVSGTFDNLTGLADFFWQKMEASPQDPQNTLMVGARFTYSADTFDPLPLEGELNARARDDPVESCKLHCLWPSFPFGAFGDDSNFSELDARAAPFWKLRVLRKDSTALPLTGRLRILLDFRKEAQTVRSAEHSLQPSVPKTAMASLTATIQESLESILLPTGGEMLQMVESCMSCPVFHDNPVPLTPLKAVQGARAGDRLSRLAEYSSTMRCFKGSVMLWCGILARMRSQWDALEAPEGPQAPTHRVNARGTRTEFFDLGVCLVQQKLELLQRSISEQRRNLQSVPEAEGFYLAEDGEQRRAPELLSPPLLTEDVLLQRDTASASLSPAERAELCGREMRSDMAAFKAAQPASRLPDFAYWRRSVLGLSLDPFPEDWLQTLWDETASKPASMQQVKLFEPEREAEMALHYLESIEGLQLLLQLFRVLLKNTIQDLSAQVVPRATETTCPPYLRMLRDRVLSATTSAFSWRGSQSSQGNGGAHQLDGAEVDAEEALVGESAEFPGEEQLQTILATLEVFESSIRLASSLRAKLGQDAEALLEELLTEGEVDITLPEQRKAVERLFARSRILERDQDEDEDDDETELLGVVGSLPLAKEFVLQLQPTSAREGSYRPRRLYAEVRENHVRLATVRGLSYG